MPSCSKVSFCRKLCMTYISHIVLLIGVPVANTMPLPPFNSLMYSHFKNISMALWLPVPVIPETFILLKMARFLNACASSTIIESMPSSSKVIRSSFLSSEVIFLICSSSRFFCDSICLIVHRSLFCDFISSIAWAISSICFRIIASLRSGEIGIFSNCEWLIMIQS